MNSILKGLSGGDAAENETEATQVDPFMDDELESPLTGIAPKEPVACYKNKQYRRFQMGEFNFHDHLCYVYSEEENNRFRAAYSELPHIEQIAIVQYNFQAVQNLEKPVGLAVRGATSSTNIKDPKVVK